MKHYFLRGLTAAALLTASLLMLTACGTVANLVAGIGPGAVPKIQAFYADLKADAALWVVAHPGDAPAIAKLETTLDPEIAALSSASSPATISGVLTDISNGVTALPPGVLSPAHTAELQAVLGLAQGVLQLSGLPAVTPPVSRALGAPLPVRI